MYSNQESRLYAEQKEKEIKAGTRFSEKDARAKLKGAQK